jgi:hypothetical protein
MYINEEGTCDDKGRKYLIEASTDKWLDRHRRCIEGPTFEPDPYIIAKLNKKVKGGDENEQAEDQVN